MLEWTEPKPPTEGISYYDHVIAQSPLGEIKIEWKSWKEFNPGYDATIGNTNDWLDCGDTLDDAKEIVFQYLKTKYEELGQILDIHQGSYTERRIVIQDWYETEFSKTGWNSHGWSFKDSGHHIDSTWTVVEHLDINKFGNPILGIAEKVFENNN